MSTDEPIPVLPGQTDALALLDPNPVPVGAAGQCLTRVVSPGLEALGVYFHCWRPTPCPDHDHDQEE